MNVTDSLTLHTAVLFDQFEWDQCILWLILDFVCD